MSETTELQVNHINVQVFQLLEDLEAVGNMSNPRGFKCREANLATLDIDPLHSVMDFGVRPFNWKYYAGELAWYIGKTNEIDFINNFSSFWKGICPDGKCNSNYGHILLAGHPSTKAEDDPIGGKNQLEWVYNSLVKDKDSRQAVAFLNCPHYQYEGNKDFVCTMYLNFWIRHNTLDMKVQMRSNDIFFGLTYDATWFATLHQSMFLNLKKVYPDLKLGTYYHCADNIHYYERHFEEVNKILDEGLGKSYKMTLKHPIFRFDEKGEIFLSMEAMKFAQHVYDIVEDESLFKSMKKEDWKNELGMLYTIE